VGPSLVPSTQWLQLLFAGSAQANDALTVDISPLMIASSERMLFKKPLLKSLLSTHVTVLRTQFSTFIQRGDTEGRPELRFLRTDNTRYPHLDHAVQGSPAGRIQWSLGTRLPFDAWKADLITVWVDSLWRLLPDCRLGLCLLS
jgi:hypothetical protein